MVGVDGAIAALRSAAAILMRDSAILTRPDGSSYTEDRVKLERMVASRSNDEGDTTAAEMRMGRMSLPWDSEARMGYRVQDSTGDIWYAVDDNAAATIRGTLELSLVQQSQATPSRVVKLFYRDAAGETVEMGEYAVQLAYSGLLPTVTTDPGARSRRVDVTLIGDGSFPARPGLTFSYGGLVGVILDVTRPQVNRTEATGQIMRGVPE